VDLAMAVAAVLVEQLGQRAAQVEMARNILRQIHGMERLILGQRPQEDLVAVVVGPHLQPMVQQ
jgi:hypothetical protein